MEAEVVAAEPVAPVVETPIANAPEPADPHKGTVSEIRLAAQRLAQRRTELKAERAAAQESAPPQEESPPQEGDAAPVAEPPSGETEAVEPEPVVEVPPLDPPRSWTMEDKETFRALPRETQTRLVELDRARELEVRKVQNEIAEQRKGFESEQQAMVQARQQYENALPLILQQMQTSGEFSDIKTIEDVKNLANTDWPRYVQWDAHSKMLAAMQQEIQITQQRQQQEQAQEWQSYVAKEDAAFRERVPDADSLRQPAIDYLKDAGFADNEIAEYWNSKAWRDHRMQSVIADAVRYRQAKAKAAAAQKAPLPPVLKPGVAQAKPAPFSAEIKALEAKGALNLREAARLSQLRRASAS